MSCTAPQIVVLDVPQVTMVDIEQPDNPLQAELDMLAEELIPEKKRRRVWTKDEDKTILNDKDWSEVLKDRTMQACKCRLRRLNKAGPLISSGEEWTEDEDFQVKNGVDVLTNRSFAAIEKRKSYLLQMNGCAI